MATEIYGASDDLIEFGGDVRGEVYAYDREDKPNLIFCSDGTLLSIKLGKAAQSIWAIEVIRKGDLFDRLDICEDEDADRYSDTAYFRPGLKWAYVAKEWERAK